MKQQLLRIMACGAACFVLGAQGQTSADRPGATPGAPANPPSTKFGTSPDQTTDTSSYRYGATGRMHHELRASKMIGADVKSIQGESLGKIEDVIINPVSGRIDFAVISYTGTTASTDTTSASPTPTTPTTPSATGEKLVPVPWTFLGHQAWQDTAPPPRQAPPRRAPNKSASSSAGTRTSSRALLR